MRFLIAENPQGRIANPTWFNRWVPNHGGTSTGLQQLALDTLWYIDPDAGIDGVWENALASEPPIYNDDFTEMTVKLRSGIYWSDGVEFTADDLVYTVQAQMDHPTMTWGSAFLGSVDSMEEPDKNTVVFKLKRPNSRFHANFTVRWGACWIIPKHIFEKQADPSTYDFNPPISLGPLHAEELRPERRVVHLAEARRLAAHDAREVRRARPEIRRLYRSRSAGQARDPAAEPPARHHPRHIA